MTDFLLRFRDVTGGLQDGLRESPFAASVPEPSVDFSGAPNLCARFKQSLALRSKFAEKSFLLALALPTDWSSCHRSLLATCAQWAEERHCLKYSSGLHFVVLFWQAASARQRRVGGSLSACACSSASESFLRPFWVGTGRPERIYASRGLFCFRALADDSCEGPSQGRWTNVLRGRASSLAKDCGLWLGRRTQRNRAAQLLAAAGAHMLAPVAVLSHHAVVDMYPCVASSL